MRICGDQPFIDPDIFDAVLESHAKSRADYTSTAIKRTFPKGVDVEVINRDSLFQVGKNATLHEKEHVTPRFFSDSSFRTNNFLAPKELRFPKRNLCLDTSQDLNYLREIYCSMKRDDFETKDIINLIKKHPEIKRKPLIVFRTDGGWKHGMGHIYPSLDICRELKKRRTDTGIS